MIRENIRVLIRYISEDQEFEDPELESFVYDKLVENIVESFDISKMNRITKMFC